MNTVCNKPAKYNTVKISGKPNVVTSKAVVGKLPIKALQNIDPQATPVKAYIKKAK